MDYISLLINSWGGMANASDEVFSVVYLPSIRYIFSPSWLSVTLTALQCDHNFQQNWLTDDMWDYLWQI